MPRWFKPKSTVGEWNVARESFITVEPDTPGEISVEPEPAGEITGDRPCSVAGCERTDAVQCAYVDRRNRPCPSSACPVHQTVERGHVFCAQHAATLMAVGIDAPWSARPDLDNAAPAIVSWMFRDLHDGVMAAMDGVARYDQGESIAVDEFARVVRTADGRLWSQGWRLIDHTGTALTVSVEAREEPPGNMAVRVGARTLVDEVPPWLQQDGDDDPELRRSYLARIIEGIVAMMERERRTDRQLVPAPF